jgi:DNA-binding MarR family transcriptional regulator
VGAGFHAARDDNALREIERALSLLAGREERWHMYQRLAAGAQLGLEPPELWTLARLGERPPLPEPELVEQLRVDPQPLDEALAGLRRRSLLASGTDGGIALTAEGEGAYQRLVEVRSARLNELLSGWQPEQEAELRGVVDRLSRDLVSALPRPPELDESV